jgi:hypothetical protein
MVIYNHREKQRGLDMIKNSIKEALKKNGIKGYSKAIISATG